MDRFLDELDLLLVRLEAGQGPSQAAAPLKLRPPPEHKKAWQSLWPRLERGELPIVASLEQFREQLLWARRLRSLTQQKSLMARSQAYLICALSLGLLVVGRFVFPTDTRLYAPAVALLLIGLYWMQRLVRRFQKQEWYGHWNLYLSALGQQLQWGQSLAQALSNLQAPPATLPRSLRQELKIWQHELNQGKFSARSEGASATTLERLAHSQLELLKQQAQAGLSLQGLLQKLLPRALDFYERQLELEAEKLGLRCLLPLFCCFLPAHLLLLFGPLLGLFFSGAAGGV